MALVVVRVSVVVSAPLVEGVGRPAVRLGDDIGPLPADLARWILTAQAMVVLSTPDEVGDALVADGVVAGTEPDDAGAENGAQVAGEHGEVGRGRRVIDRGDRARFDCCSCTIELPQN